MARSVLNSNSLLTDKIFMAPVNPTSTAIPVIQTGNVPVTAPEERQVGLRLEQIVRATVVESGFDRVVLEMDHRRYRAQGDLELQTGQKLTLQVLQTRPKLEFRVLYEPLGDRLMQLLPWLTRPYDWAGLVGRLRQQASQSQSPAMTQVYRQLQQLLRPAGDPVPGMAAEIARLAARLQQLTGSTGEAAAQISKRATNRIPLQYQLPSPMSATAPQPGPAQGREASQPPVLPGSAFAQSPALTPQAPSPAPAGRVAAAVAGMPAGEIVFGLETLLSQVQEVQLQRRGLPPDLLGRLEGLLGKVRQVFQATELASPTLPGLEAIASQLTRLVSQSALRPAGGQLGVLSQLFGLHLETELLAGKKKAALASLKLGLLMQKEELAGKAEEPLQQLELFQLCKARLAEEQVQFLPLPLPELEEGYLLVERQPEPDEEAEGAPLQLSLSLRLSALGNLRVDMLYEGQGLHLRLACEDRPKVRYLQDCKAELKEAITAVPLQGISYAADAQNPARQLLERLVPERAGVLDDRV